MMTLSEWAEQWLAWEAHAKKPSTVDAHRYVVKNHLLPAFGTALLGQLTAKSILNYVDGLQKKDGDAISPSTRRNIVNTFRLCLQQAVKEVHLRRNPLSNTSIPCPEEVSARILNRWEIEDYLSAAEKLGRRAIFALMLSTGIKVGEVIQLRWEDVHPRKQELKVPGDRRRILPLRPSVLQGLKEEHDKHPGRPGLFLHPGNLQPFHRNAIFETHRRICRIADLEGVRLIDLRHTFAVRSLEQGLDPALVASMLGADKPGDILRIYKRYLS